MFDTYLRFLPITVFALLYRFYDWQIAFLVGGLLSAFQIAFFLYKNIPFNRFVLAINLFLLSAALSIVFNFMPLLEFYQKLEQTTVFMWLCIVGTITSFTPRGFINVDSTHTKHNQTAVTFYSLILLAATFIATLFSWKFHHYHALSTIVPFFSLIVLNIYLIKQYYQR